jgi:hypothetical protein
MHIIALFSEGEFDISPGKDKAASLGLIGF